MGAGWIITEENWLKENDVLNYLKLKASIGYTGNAAFPPDQWREKWSRSGQYNGTPILYPTLLPNPNLQWENTRAIDVGLEFGLYRDRITGEVSYYNKASDQVLIQVQIPRAFGFASKWDNVAEITNQGVEFSINSRNLVGDFTWTTEYIAYNSNEITSIGGYSPDAVSGGTNDTRVVVGSPVGTNFLVRFSHIDPSNGRPVYLDISGNETYTWTPDDRVPVGNVLPDAVGGINNTFTYKGFPDFSFLFAFVIGGDIYDSSSKRQLGVMSIGDGLWNMTPHIFDRWQQLGDNSRYARLTTENANLGSETPWINTDLWLHDGSFLP